MVKRKKYLWRHPSGRVYFRPAGGKYIPITAKEGTAEFDRQYWDILTGRRADTKRSWAALVELLRHDAKWADLSPRYRADLEPVFAYLIERIGRQEVSRLTQADVYDAMDANMHRVRFARYIPTAVSMLAKLAIRRRWRTDNPAVGVDLPAMPKAKRKPHLPWTDAAVDKWRAEALPLPRLIFEIGVGSVQRPGDWVGFTWGDYDGRSLRLRQNKTDVPLWLPCTAVLRQTLDATKDAFAFIALPTRHILTNAQGNPMRLHTLQETMRKERERLGLLAFDQHGLRYRGVMELAWAGCDDDEIASFSGHTTKAMIRKYAGEARQMMRAQSAATKRMNGTGTEREPDTQGDTL